MTLISEFPLAAPYINKYVWSKMREIDQSLSDYGNIVPFFPVSDTRADEWPWQTKPYVIYDQLFRLRAKPGYFVKKAQIIYSVKGNPTEVLQWANAIGMILDRQDVTGQEINEWIENNEPSAGIFFHWARVMQIDATNENRMDVSVNQKYLATMIVEVEYHVTKSSKFD